MFDDTKEGKSHDIPPIGESIARTGPPEPSMTWNEEQGWLRSAALGQSIQAEMRRFLRPDTPGGSSIIVSDYIMFMVNRLSSHYLLPLLHSCA